MKFQWTEGRRVPRLVSCLLALALGLMVPASRTAGAVGPVPEPAWTVGDFWEYRASGAYGNGTFTYVVRVEVTAIEDITVNAHAWRVYNTTETYEFTVRPYVESGTFREWHRVSDLASVRFAYVGPLGSMFIDYDPPAEIHWPLAAGMEWDGFMTEMYFLWGQQVVSTYAYRFTVADGGTHVTAAGTFETLLLRVEYPGANRPPKEVMQYSPLVGNTVMQTATGFPDCNLTSFRFQRAPVQVLLGAGIVTAVTVAAVTTVLYALRGPSRGTSRDGEALKKRPDSVERSMREVGDRPRTR